MSKTFTILLLGMIIVTSWGYTLTLDNATYKVGERFYKQGLYIEAEQRFLDLVKKYPDSLFYRKSLLYLGKIYTKIGNHKAALQYYRFLLNKARQIKEKQYAILGIAKSWLQLGMYDKAAQFYSFFAIEYPESEFAAGSLFFAGISREREDKIIAAIEKYRAVFELYPDSSYYAKAIEKVAVLDQKAPVELLNIEDSSLQKNNQEELFTHDDLISDFNIIDFKAQDIDNTLSVAPASITQQLYPAPTVLTQFVPAPPIYITQEVQSSPQVITQTVLSKPEIITQMIKEVITQQINYPQQLPDEIQQMINSPVIHMSNGQYIPIETPEQIVKRKELEEYKKIWESEYKAKLKEQELIQAESSIKDMLEMVRGKAGILDVKESTLIEKENKFRNGLYEDLKDIKALQSEYRFTTPPTFTTLTPAITNKIFITNEVRINSDQDPVPLEVVDKTEPSIDEINVAEQLDEYSIEEEFNQEYGGDYYEDDANTYYAE